MLKTPLWFTGWFWTLPFKRYNHEAASWMWLMAFSYWLQNMIGILALAFFFIVVGGDFLDVFNPAWLGSFQEEIQATVLLLFIFLFVWQIFYWISYYIVTKSVGQRPGNFFTWGLRNQFGRKVRALLEYCDQYVDRMD